MAKDQTKASWHSTESWVRFGFKTVGGFLAMSLLAAIVFSVSGAVIANGVVTVEGSYQTIQHRDGGIVKDILVKNGDLVKRNDVLIKMDATTARAALNVTNARINELRVQKARLESELSGSSTIQLPTDLQSHVADQGFSAMLASQRALFAAKRNARAGEEDVLTQRIRQLQSQLHGLQSQFDARAKEARLNRKTLHNIRKLYDQGYANRQQLIAAERDAARVTGDSGRLKSELSRVRSAITEARLRLSQSKKTYTQAAVDELRKVRMTLGELRQTRKTQAAQLKRIEIRSPQAGYVHALSVHTIGGVVAPGATILQIIPIEKNLLIEARIRPSDVDKVHIGQAATIRFPAFNAKSTPALKGKVASVSAAQLDDPRSGSYFSVLIGLPADELAKIGNGHRLIPGMPAEVFIETEARPCL